MDNKEKLLRAKSAMEFLKRAISTMDSQELIRTDPDYDLWRAFKELKEIQDAWDSK